jgi:serine/threonine protein kinase
MNTNLGEGLSAKCVITPNLKCGIIKRSRKYVSKIVEIPYGDSILKDIMNNEIDISKSIKKSNKSRKWINNNFSLINRKCPKSKLTKSIIKKCNLSLKKKNEILLMRNVGCDSSKKYTNNCGDLSTPQVLNRIKILGPDFIKQIIVKLLKAILFLHSINISHCDLKNGNIVMDSNNNVRIIDFGSSINVSTINLDRKKLFRKISMATPYFVPPEFVIAQHTLYNSSKETIINKTFKMSGLKKTSKNTKLIEKMYKNRNAIINGLFNKKSPIIFKYDVYSLGRFLDIIYKFTGTKMPKDIKPIVNKMLEPDYNKRYSIKDCLRKFNIF